MHFVRVSGEKRWNEVGSRFSRRDLIIQALFWCNLYERKRSSRSMLPPHSVDSIKDSSTLDPEQSTTSHEGSIPSPHQAVDFVLQTSAGLTPCFRTTLRCLPTDLWQKPLMLESYRPFGRGTMAQTRTLEASRPRTPRGKESKVGCSAVTGRSPAYQQDSAR